MGDPSKPSLDRLGVVQIARRFGSCVDQRQGEIGTQAVLAPIQYRADGFSGSRFHLNVTGTTSILRAAAVDVILDPKSPSVWVAGGAHQAACLRLARINSFTRPLGVRAGWVADVARRR